MTPTHETEAQFQAWVVDAAHTYGWRVAHFRTAPTGSGGHATPTAYDGAGFPDLVLVNTRGPGVIFAELKSERGRLTHEQQQWGGDINAAGGRHHVWRPSNRAQITRVLRGVES